jgi:hypothetical protein
MSREISNISVTFILLWSFTETFLPPIKYVAAQTVKVVSL